MPVQNLLRPLSRLLFLLLLSVGLAGCKSSALQAERLPAQFRAQRSHGDRNINLAQIASPGTSNDILAPGDLLEITVSTGREKEAKDPVITRIAENGEIDVPIIGTVAVAGLEAFDASQSIKNVAIQRGMYRHPLVTVEIKSKAVNRITVLGEVNEPGVHELPRGSSDLVSALAAAGGLTDEASTVVEVIRQPKFGLAATESPAGPIATVSQNEIELASYQNLPLSSNQQRRSVLPVFANPMQVDLAGGGLAGRADFRLQDRDVVRIKQRKNEMIYVTGLVLKPGQFDLPHDQDLYLLDAIALAGGLKSAVADKVLIIRRIENQAKPLAIQASLLKAKKNGLENIRLAAGDTISVEQTPVTAVIDTLGKFFRLTFGVASNTVF